MIPVTIATAFPLVREGLLRTLHAERGVLVKSVASDAEAVLDCCGPRRSDVLLLHAELPGIGTAALLRRLHQKGCAEAVVLFGKWTPESASAARGTGCCGLLSESDDPDIFVRAVHFAAAGDRFVSDHVGNLLREMESRADGGAHGRIERLLTPTELQILRALGDNHTSREIADRMFISYRTVQKHRNNITRKLGLDGSNALLVFAMKHFSRRR
jgi:DNA-binding NarL/FixJ family response regulator